MPCGAGVRMQGPEHVANGVRGEDHWDAQALPKEGCKCRLPRAGSSAEHDDYALVALQQVVCQRQLLHVHAT